MHVWRSKQRVAISRVTGGLPASNSTSTCNPTSPRKDTQDPLAPRNKPHIATGRINRTSQPAQCTMLFHRFRRGRSSLASTSIVPSIAQKIPDDIIHEILLRLADISFAKFTGPATIKELRAFLSSVFPFNVSVVCRSWRATALSVPRWWSTQFIEFRNLGIAAMPFNIIGSWFEACLTKSDASGHGINGMVLFSGYYSARSTDTFVLQRRGPGFAPKRDIASLL